MEKYDGGSAFPNGDQRGMSLRDYFAGQALSGLIASAEEHFVGSGKDEAALLEWRASIDRQWADFCYSMADAMLVERDKS